MNPRIMERDLPEAARRLFNPAPPGAVEGVMGEFLEHWRNPRSCGAHSGTATSLALLSGMDGIKRKGWNVESELGFHLRVTGLFLRWLSNILPSNAFDKTELMSGILDWEMGLPYFKRSGKGRAKVGSNLSRGWKYATMVPCRVRSLFDHPFVFLEYRPVIHVVNNKVEGEDNKDGWLMTPFPFNGWFTADDHVFAAREYEGRKVVKDGWGGQDGASVLLFQIARGRGLRGFDAGVGGERRWEQWMTGKGYSGTGSCWTTGSTSTTSSS